MQITLTKTEYHNIYVPNDDSYLFLDALKSEMQNFPSNSIIVEMGCGSGILIGNITKLLQDNNNAPLISIGIDINYDACIASQRIMQQNSVYTNIINADGMKGLNFNQFGIDIFIFNPPYVPTEEEEIIKCQEYFKQKQKVFQEAYNNNITGQELIDKVATVNLIDCSYAGGKNGMLITWDILQQAIKVMNENGIIYLFVIQDNPINEIIDFFKKNGYDAYIIKRQQKYNEIQFVMKLLSKMAKSLTTQQSMYAYHFPNGSVYSNPAVTAKRIIKVVGERLRKIDPERWEGTPITFNTNWNDAAGYVDVATCIHIHDALEKEFGIEVKDRAFLVSSIETAFYIVNIHHDSH